MYMEEDTGVVTNELCEAGHINICPHLLFPSQNNEHL